MKTIRLLKLSACVLFIALQSCSKESEDIIPSKEPDISYVRDADGNQYEVIKVGNQTWFKDNLNSAKFNDGTAIPAVHNANSWKILTSEGWTNYQGSSAYNSIDGKFYNWYAVNSGKLCPKGWHVPTESEWKTLLENLGGDKVAGGKMKQTFLWDVPNKGADNSSGFTARPTGYKEADGSSQEKGKSSFYWSATQKAAFNTAASVQLFYLTENAFRSDENKRRGHCVRCIKD